MGKYYLLVVDYFSRFSGIGLLETASLDAIVVQRETVCARHDRPNRNSWEAKRSFCLQNLGRSRKPIISVISHESRVLTI